MSWEGKSHYFIALYAESLPNHGGSMVTVIIFDRCLYEITHNYPRQYGLT
jgi:hypothetical protein